MSLTRRTALILVPTCLLALAITIISAGWILRRVYTAYERAREAEVQRDEKTLRDLTAEFDRMAPPSNDIRTRYGTMLGLVSADYKSQLTWEQIKTHYNEELVAYGWRHLRDEPIIYEGHNYGGESVIYCKPPYAVSIQYVGRQEAQFGFTYGLSFTADLHDECK